MKTVYVIFYEGPEWNDPIEGYVSNHRAKTRAAELNKMRNITDKSASLDALSEYVVKSITIMDMPS
jgi:hypothetical protein